MTRKLGTTLAVGAIAASGWVAGTPIATASEGFCDSAMKSSERIECHQSCDVGSEIYDATTCKNWEAVIDMEHGD
jgi:hypothetical protein